MFADGQRRFKVPRDELIVQEHKYFYWNCKTAQTCWEPPDENRKVLWNMFRGRKARRKLHEAELKRLAELEEERRHRLGQGKDVSDLELIIADRSLDTGGDVKTLALEGQPLLTQNGEVAEGAIVPHQEKVEAVNEDPVRPVWKSNTPSTQRNSLHACHAGQGLPRVLQTPLQRDQYESHGLAPVEWRGLGAISRRRFATTEISGRLGGVRAPQDAVPVLERYDPRRAGNRREKTPTTVQAVLVY